MTAQATDLVMVLTGGSNNSDTTMSIGGNPSNAPVVTGLLNNLFDDITEEQAANGYTDYRCLYIYNNNSTSYFVGVDIYLSLVNGAESDISLGLYSQSETQQINIVGNVNGGSFLVLYQAPTEDSPSGGTVNYNSDLGIWTANLETVLLSIPTFGSLTVTSQGSVPNVYFNVAFEDHTNHALLTVNPSALTTSSGTATSFVTKPIPGSPINAIPVMLDAVTTPPFEVAFSVPTAETPIQIPYLYPNEGFPLWIRRTILPKSAAINGDGFNLMISSNSQLL